MCLACPGRRALADKELTILQLVPCILLFLQFSHLNSNTSLTVSNIAHLIPIPFTLLQPLTKVNLAVPLGSQNVVTICFQRKDGRNRYSWRYIFLNIEVMKIHHLPQICWQWSSLQCTRQGELETILETEDQERKSVLLMEACCRFYPIRLCYKSTIQFTRHYKKRFQVLSTELKRTV